ncbi:hypothetical protein PR048_008438 [Dryococelus australis]|uniref:Uncharacterized protein n=1 Tax=Dryococelus australis TaxID=614101 RepID=A0ABQ9HX53_9NEOP|nr:hypothetical protein PR048_008438 [Dryococelus australis]
MPDRDNSPDHNTAESTIPLLYHLFLVNLLDSLVGRVLSRISRSSPPLHSCTCKQVWKKMLRRNQRTLLVHTVFDTFWRMLAQSSPSTVTDDDQCTVDIGISIHKTAESSLQFVELANFSVLLHVATSPSLPLPPLLGGRSVVFSRMTSPMPVGESDGIDWSQLAAGAVPACGPRPAEIGSDAGHCGRHLARACFTAGDNGSSCVSRTVENSGARPFMRASGPCSAGPPCKPAGAAAAPCKPGMSCEPRVYNFDYNSSWLVFRVCGMPQIWFSWLACSSPTMANWVQSPAGSPDFRKCESCRTMLLVSGFPQGFPVSLALSLRRCCSPQSPSPALKTSLLRATQISSLHIITEQFRLHRYQLYWAHGGFKGISNGLRNQLHKSSNPQPRVITCGGNQQHHCVKREGLVCYGLFTTTKSERPQWLSGLSTRLSPRRTGFDSWEKGGGGGGNCAGRCRWSASFLGDLPFPPLLHSAAAPYSPRIDVKDPPNLFTHSFTRLLFDIGHITHVLLLQKAWRTTCLSGERTALIDGRGVPGRRAAPAPDKEPIFINPGIKRAAGAELMTRGHLSASRGPSSLAAHSDYARPCIFTAATVAERLARSPPTKTNRAQSPAGPQDFRKWESCRTMPLVCGSSRGSPVSPAPSFRRCSLFTSNTLIGS